MLVLATNRQFKKKSMINPESEHTPAVKTVSNPSIVKHRDLDGFQWIPEINLECVA